MRAGVFVQSYAKSYDVSLLVVNIWNRITEIDPRLSSCFSSIESISIEDIKNHGLNRVTTSQLIAREYERIHVFRIQMLRLFRFYLNRHPNTTAILTLDLDDYESNLYKRMAHLYTLRHDQPRATMLLARAARFEQMEREGLELFHQVYVSNVTESCSIQSLYKTQRVFVIPNAVRINVPPDILTRGPMTLLFVGTLDYFPNEDAILWFCDSVLPNIKAKAQVKFRVLIVGSRPRDVVRKLDNGHDILICPDVADLRVFYRESHISIAPIRAASGTRIKILEAMSEALPVVTTSLGAEGLQVEDRRELLIADSAVEFADYCLELMHSRELRTKLAIAGLEWVRANHSIERVAAIIENTCRSDGLGSERPAR